MESWVIFFKMINETLKTIRKSLGLEELPNPEDHLFEDLNIHPEDLETIAKQLSEKFEIDIDADDLAQVEQIGDMLQIVKDKTDDIS